MAQSQAIFKASTDTHTGLLIVMSDKDLQVETIHRNNSHGSLETCCCIPLPTCGPRSSPPHAHRQRAACVPTGRHQGCKAHPQAHTVKSRSRAGASLGKPFPGMDCDQGGHLVCLTGILSVKK
uniref:Uncharacterized protein n=1 Tax=Molossus molossus TaxID=27622 RepID=A0A7J8HI44_MOLMO|nr:hypothetical protein HJG59_011068 [Molossus molossus]